MNNEEQILHLLTNLNTRFDSLETCIGNIEQRLDNIEQRLDSLEIRMDKVEQRLDNLETDVSEILESHANPRRHAAKCAGNQTGFAQTHTHPHYTINSSSNLPTNAFGNI